MARPLAQILTELNSVYQPQKDIYNQQVQNLDPQMDAENKGLEASKVDSFNQITSGANRRGLLFSGIPLGEQASYLGQSFLPAVANLKAKYAQQRFNLQDAIAKITQDQYLKGQDIYQTELNRDQQAADAAAARAAASRAAGAGDFGGFNFGSGGGAAPRAAAPAGPSADQRAYNAVQGLLGTKNEDIIRRSYVAIADSARRGNTYDQAKLQLLNQLWLKQGGGKAAPASITKGVGKF